MRTRKSKLRQRNPLTLKCVLEKTGDRFWKFKEVGLGTGPQGLKDFMIKSEI